MNECDHVWSSYHFTMNEKPYTKIHCNKCDEEIITPQKTDCHTVRDKYGNTYGHIFTEGDKNCRVCGEDINA